LFDISESPELDDIFGALGKVEVAVIFATVTGIFIGKFLL